MVLILVVVDVTFWAFKNLCLLKKEIGLNPCCSGCYFLGHHPKSERTGRSCLNPCCSGCYFLGPFGASFYLLNKQVLILVVVDVTFWVVLVSAGLAAILVS